MTVFALIISIVALVFSAVVLVLNIRRYCKLKKQLEELKAQIKPEIELVYTPFNPASFEADFPKEEIRRAASKAKEIH